MELSLHVYDKFVERLSFLPFIHIVLPIMLKNKAVEDKVHDVSRK